MWISLIAAVTPMGEAEFAYRCVEAYLRRTAMPAVERPCTPKGVFITVEIGGQVRACRGTLSPQAGTLQEEIRRIAQSAALHDPRYGSVQLKGRPFSITLTLVDRVEPIEDLRTLLPEHGLVLTQNEKTGIVLPFEGRDPQIRLEWAYKKAKANPRQPVRLERLLATRERFPKEPK
jgi:AMMECR1 domain-containing protein